MIADEFAWLRQLLSRLDRAIRKWDAAEEEVDIIRCYVEAFLRERSQATPRERLSTGQDVFAAIRQRDQMEKAREQHAAAGAREIKQAPMAGGAYEFLIDGQYRLKLPPRLSALLQVLAGPEGTSTDELVPWKSRLQVRQALATEAGLPITEHALNGLVSRLRKELRHQANLHRDFVMVHPSHGLRFAVQRRIRGDGTACDSL